MTSRTISLEYGKLHLFCLPSGRARVHFVNNDAVFSRPEDAPFLYLSTVEDQLLLKLEEANQCYIDNIFKHWIHKTLYETNLYCSHETKRIQLKINLVVLAWEGELHIRLCQFRRQRFIVDKGIFMHSRWRPTYSSFRFHVNDLSLLKEHFDQKPEDDWDDSNSLVNEFNEGFQNMRI